MIRALFRPSGFVFIIALAGCSGSPVATPGIMGTSANAQGSAARTAVKPLSARAVPAVVAGCPAPSAATPAPTTTSTDATGVCSHVQLSSGTYGPSTPASAVPGYHPADLQNAYHLPSLTAGRGQTIGIIVAGGNLNAESDLAVYRSTFGLPACTSANGCLRLISAAPVAKSGAAPDANWAAEVAIDLDMASAVCPNCKLLVMQASSTKSMDFFGAASLAVLSGATVLSNSFVIPESKDLKSVSNWISIGVPIVAAAGDQGFQGVTNWPASSQNAIAVGGTTLVADSSPRGWSETAWSGSGSGCSTLAQKPAWQKDTGCKNRTVADVAAVADPATPVAVYNTYQSAGWVLMGGTSVATPIVAGTYALAANGSTIFNAASLYAHSAQLNPISSGSNGSCSVSYLCVAGAGYSGPVGLGSPNGVGAF